MHSPSPNATPVASASHPHSRFKPRRTPDRTPRRSARRATARRTPLSHASKTLPKSLPKALPGISREAAGWTTAAVLGTGVLLWNWQLFLATGTGMSVTVGAYLLSQTAWRLRWADVQRWLSDTQRPIVFAIACGGISTVATYMAIAIWLSADNRWIASGTILEGLATLAVLGLLAWQRIERSSGRDAVNLAAALDDLSGDDALKQRVALRQLEDWLQRGCLDDRERDAIADCCQLLLGREGEAIVREATLELLQTLSEDAEFDGRSLPEAMGAAIDLPSSRLPSARKAATRNRELSL